jgi:hypothetical protein
MAFEVESRHLGEVVVLVGMAFEDQRDISQRFTARNSRNWGCPEVLCKTITHIRGRA